MLICKEAMMPGIGGLNPKKMQAMMKQLGINSEDINAERVIIEKSDGRIVIENPSVQRIVMQGQESWQIAGQAREENTGGTGDDVRLIMEKTGKDENEARKALEETGDIAEAIMKLSHGDSAC